ncbi:MAG: 4-oxalocrotonate tautomerase family protein [Oceanospirillaceae bacterium]|nr:4-oxalocrotonate tautomerase family protein [Oceanospirillaceae bacterium]
MPIINVLMLEGRSIEQKQALIAKVTDAVCETIDVPSAAVRVIIQDIPPTQWGVGGEPKQRNSPSCSTQAPNV